MYTPESNIGDYRYQKWPYFKGVHLFQTIILGIQPSVFGDVIIVLLAEKTWKKDISLFQNEQLKNTGCFGGDYTIRSCGDYNKPLIIRIPFNQPV